VNAVGLTTGNPAGFSQPTQDAVKPAVLAPAGSKAVST
jgi:hypothetical protein